HTSIADHIFFGWRRDDAQFGSSSSSTRESSTSATSSIDPSPNSTTPSSPRFRTFLRDLETLLRVVSLPLAVLWLHLTGRALEIGLLTQCSLLLAVSNGIFAWSLCKLLLEEDAGVGFGVQEDRIEDSIEGATNDNSRSGKKHDKEKRIVVLDWNTLFGTGGHPTSALKNSGGNDLRSSPASSTTSTSSTSIRSPPRQASGSTSLLPGGPTGSEYERCWINSLVLSGICALFPSIARSCGILAPLFYESTFATTERLLGGTTATIGGTSFGGHNHRGLLLNNADSDFH
ncbi:unnamed protein product, partial [Amoebophrya sp. A25]